MKLLAIKYLMFVLVTLCFCSCSHSDDEIEVYDYVLSHTKWTQVYSKPNDSVVEEDFWAEGIPEGIKQMLEVVELPATEVVDTVWNLDVQGKYVLTFANDDCTLENRCSTTGSYKIHTFIRIESYYPNQSHSMVDEQTNRQYDVVVQNDTLKFVVTYIGEGMNIVLFEREKFLPHMYDDATLQMSTSYPYSVEKKEIHHMTFTRNGRHVILSGHKEYVGVLNDERDEMELSELGTLYLTK